MRKAHSFFFVCLLILVISGCAFGSAIYHTLERLLKDPELIEKLTVE